MLIEIDNECNVTKYDHDILKPARVHELIARAKSKTRDGKKTPGKHQLWRKQSSGGKRSCARRTFS